MPIDPNRIPETPEFWRQLEEELRAAAEQRNPNRFRPFAIIWRSVAGALARPARIALRQGLGHALASLAVVTAALVPVITQSGHAAKIGVDSAPTAFSVWALSGPSDRLLGEGRVLDETRAVDGADHAAAVASRRSQPDSPADPIDGAWLASEDGESFEVGERMSPFSPPPLTDGNNTAL